MKEDNVFIPQLRFNLFSESWKLKQLSELIIEYKKKSIFNNQYPVLTSSKRGLMLQSEYYANDNPISERDNLGFNILPEDYITYRSRSDNRSFSFNFNNLGFTGIISIYYPVFKVEKCNNYFLTTLLNYYKSKIGKYSVGTSQTVLSINELKKMKFLMPSLEEQQKIANFLTSVDERIQTLEKKKALLEQYKKGVMQKIFKQEIRFKDENGEEFPEWEKYKLSDISERIKTKNKIDNQNVLTISAQLGLVSQLEYFNKSVSAKNLTGYYLLEKNDFAYNKSYSKGYPMGAIKRLNKYDLGVVSTLYICFRFNQKVSLDFMEQYFDAGLQNREIEKVAQEGARNHGLLNIGVNIFFEIDLKIPSLKEQTKIANFLSAIDKNIAVVNNKIEKTKNYKKGLLQQMFV